MRCIPAWRKASLPSQNRVCVAYPQQLQFPEPWDLIQVSSSVCTKEHKIVFKEPRSQCFCRLKGSLMWSLIFHIQASDLILDQADYAIEFISERKPYWYRWCARFYHTAVEQVTAVTALGVRGIKRSFLLNTGVDKCWFVTPAWSTVNALCVLGSGLPLCCPPPSLCLAGVCCLLLRYSDVK